MEIRPTEDGVPTVYSPRYGETYHSIKGAMRETQHVFVQGNEIPSRLSPSGRLTILEVGFGTGLNFLATADLFVGSRANLEFVSCESALLDSEVLSKLNYGAFLRHPELFDAMNKWRIGLDSLPETIPFLPASNISLRLLDGDARDAPLGQEVFDVIYLDAFSPETNPELWSESFLAKLFTACKTGGTLTTYCAKGVVRRQLAALGFKVTRRDGPPGKRHMTHAHKPERSS